MSRRRLFAEVLLWTASVLVALVCLRSGLMKLPGVPGEQFWARDFRRWGYPDWFRVFADLQLETLMRQKRIKEIWFADSGMDGGYPSYNPAAHRIEDFRVNYESNMASPFTGDISNSFREPDDLPILDHTYIVYGINYRRTQAEAVHNVGHQMEAIKT